MSFSRKRLKRTRFTRLLLTLRSSGFVRIKARSKFHLLSPLSLLTRPTPKLPKERKKNASRMSKRLNVFARMSRSFRRTRRRRLVARQSLLPPSSQ